MGNDGIAHGHHDAEETVMAYYAGIDLGTTNSAIATCRTRSTETLEEPRAERCHPSTSTGVAATSASARL